MNALLPNWRVFAIVRTNSSPEKTSLPAIDVLEDGGIPTFKINADQTPDEIYTDIIEALKTVNIKV